MPSNPSLRPAAIGFICCGLGFLVAAVLARQPMFLGAGLPFLGAGIVFLAKSRQMG